jgi:hypothetical protein
MDDSPEDSMLAESYARGQTQKNLVERDRCTSFRHHPHRATADWCDVGQVTIGILPDDILLCIFYVYVNGPYKKEEWHTLVHVCRRWRTLVFGSPYHLNLQLFCSVSTPVTKKLDIWPDLPIVVSHHYDNIPKMDNLIAAIKHNDRVCKIDFRTFYDIPEMKKVVSAMQVPFPALTDLKLLSGEAYGIVTVIPDSFLGGSAPRLQRLHLGWFLFPGLPKLHLSATSLVSLHLDLSLSWYISPDAMVACLSTLVHLKSFTLTFPTPQSRESRHLLPPARTLLPALTLLRFKGTHEYAEDLITRIDAPLLHRLHIIFFKEALPNVPQLSQFITRIPKFQIPDKAHISFSGNDVEILFLTRTGERLSFGISCEIWQRVGIPSFLVLVCRSLPALTTVEDLYIYKGGYPPLYDDKIENSQAAQQDYLQVDNPCWRELLHLFPTVTNLYVSEEYVPHIAFACQETAIQDIAGEIGVLPALENLFLEGYSPWRPLQDAVTNFIVGRQLSNLPIAVSCWDRKCVEWDDWDR